MAYLVIIDNGAHDGHIVEMNENEWASQSNPDGYTEQDVCGPHGDIYGRHKTKEAAEEELRNYIKCDSSSKGDYCYSHNPNPR